MKMASENQNGYRSIVIWLLGVLGSLIVTIAGIQYKMINDEIMKLRGDVQMISYQYEKLNQELWQIRHEIRRMMTNSWNRVLDDE